MTTSAPEAEQNSNETTVAETTSFDNVTFGAFLTKAREAKNLSMDDLAHQTKIRRAIIEALETNARRELPEKVFVLGYVRSYAMAVGLNVEETLHRFNVTWVDESQIVATDDSKKSGTSFAWLSPTLAALFAVFAFWYILRIS